MSDELDTAKAIIRALIGGWYTHVDCHREGMEAPRPHCDCAGCRTARAAISFLNEHKDTMNSQSDPTFTRLYMDAKA